MCYVEETPISCGILEVSDVGDTSPLDTIEIIWHKVYYENEPKTIVACGMIVWSDVTGKGRSGAKLKRFIEKTFRKGEVGQSFYAKNPNSNNNIRIFFWRFPKVEFLKWGLSRELTPSF